MSNIHTWSKKWGIPPQCLKELMDLSDPSRLMVRGDSDSEAAVQAGLRVTAPKYGASLWRNNNGASMMVNLDKPNDPPRHVRFGLGNDSKKLSEVWKSSDLIGITPVTSTMPGQTFGVFTAVEVKKPGWKKPANKRERGQEAFIVNVRRMGGIGMFAQSVADYEGMFK